MSVKNSAMTMIAIIGLIIPVGAVVWNYFQLVSTVKDLSVRMETAEATPHSSENTSFKRRLASSEASINQMNNTLGKLNADIGRIDNATNGLGEGLAERVKILEKQLTSLPKDKITKLSERIAKLEKDTTITSNNSDNQSNLLAKITGLEGKIEKLAKIKPATGNSTSNIIKIDADFSEKLPTQTVRSFEYSLIGCKRKNTNVTCSLLVKNISDKMIETSFKTNEVSVFTPLAKEQKATNVTMGQKNSNSYVYSKFPTGIPIRISYTFPNIKKDISGFLSLNITNGADFRNITITDAI